MIAVVTPIHCAVRCLPCHRANKLNVVPVAMMPAAKSHQRQSKKNNSHSLSRVPGPGDAVERMDTHVAKYDTVSTEMILDIASTASGALLFAI